MSEESSESSPEDSILIGTPTKKEIRNYFTKGTRR
jgi:hypothetical protein